MGLAFGPRVARTPKIKKTLEGDLQIALFKWAQAMEDEFPELKWLHAVPNGGSRDGREAVSLKLQGVKSGVVDIDLPVSRIGSLGQIICGLKIELKRPDSNEKPSKEQAEYMDFCRGQGYWCFWTTDLETAKTIILGYLKQEPNKGQ